MSWQICREVLNAYVDPAYQIATAFLTENKFWNLKAGRLEVGISDAKLEKVICSRDVEAVLIKGFYEQTLLSLYKKIQSNWTGYMNMTDPVKVLRLLPWKQKTKKKKKKKKNNIYYHFTNTDRAKRSRKENKNNILSFSPKSRVNR